MMSHCQGCFRCFNWSPLMAPEKIPQQSYLKGFFHHTMLTDYSNTQGLFNGTRQLTQGIRQRKVMGDWCLEVFGRWLTKKGTLYLSSVSFPPVPWHTELSHWTYWTLATVDTKLCLVHWTSKRLRWFPQKRQKSNCDFFRFLHFAKSVCLNTKL